MDASMLSSDTLGPHLRSWRLPLIYLQGTWLKRTMRQLPEPDDARAGEVAGAQPALRVLVFGDSAAVAVGASSQARGLAACIAEAMAARTQRAVYWRAHGRSGMTALDCDAELATLLAGHRAGEHDYDLIVTSLGGNDAVKLSASEPFLAAMRHALAQLQPLLTAHGRIVLGRAPPFACSPVFRDPLRALVAWRTERINLLLGQLAREQPRTQLADEPVRLAASDFAADGFHPSESSYRVWGEHLVERYAPVCPAVVAVNP